MKLHTASETINFSEKLESYSARFYTELSQRYPQHRDVFESFAAENKKNVQKVKRAYYEVITDAIEGGFAFDIETNGYVLHAESEEVTEYSKLIETVTNMENTIIKFYSDAAEQSKSLMADVPRSLTLVARKRSERIPKLKAIQKESAKEERM